MVVETTVMLNESVIAIGGRAKICYIGDKRLREPPNVPSVYLQYVI